jgi:hypothetical protein
MKGWLSIRDIKFYGGGRAAVPVIIYASADTDKLKILSDNKGKSGVYLWKNLKNQKQYVPVGALARPRGTGSSIDLRKLKGLNPYFVTGFSDGEACPQEGHARVGQAHSGLFFYFTF